MPSHSLDGRVWVTIIEAAKQMGVSRRTVYNWFEKGLLETMRTPSGHIRIAASSLLKPEPAKG